MGLKEIRGDVIDIALAAEPGQTIVIPHVCNNVGVMGAGVARALADTWPQILKPYKVRCSTKTTGLGSTVIVNIRDSMVIANMIAQEGIGNYSARPPIRYGHLASCMKEVRDYILVNKSLNHDTVIISPKFGSGLAGGNWDVITQMILEIWIDHYIDVTIVRFD